MRRLPVLVILATSLAACEQAAPSTGHVEPNVIRTEVVDPATIPPPPAPTPHKPLLTDPPVAPPPVIEEDPLPTEPTTDADPKAPVKQGDLELISNGAEPRFALAYHPVEGAKEALTMSNSMSMAAPPDPEIIFPKTIVGATVAATHVAKDGTVTLEITLTSADAEDVPGSKIPADQVKAQMGDVAGMKTSVRVDAHGKMTDEHGKEIQQVEQTQMGFNQLAAPLPIDPVGVGAKWKIKQTLEQGELKLRQVMTYEVIAVTATSVKLKSSGRLSAPPQTIDWQGQKVDLDKTTGSASATLTIDFTRLVPEVRGTVSMTMNMSAGDEKQSMTTKSVMTMHAKKK